MEYWPEKSSSLFLHCNPDGPKVPEMFVIRIHLGFGTHVPPKQLILFLLSRCQFKAFYLCCIINRLKIIDFSRGSGILMDWKCKKNVCFLDMPGQSNSYLSSVLLA